MNRILVETAVAVALAFVALAAWEDPGARIAAEDGAGHALARLRRALASTSEAIATQAQAVPKDARVAREAMSDTAIDASIRADLLKDPDLSVLKIDVDTHHGVVVLNGLAQDEAARERAGRIALSVKGVREVRNYLVVKRA